MRVGRETSTWIVRSAVAIAMPLLVGTLSAQVQAPALPRAQPISASDRVYTADQTSNTVSVISPVTNELLGTIPLGNARPDAILDPNYHKQINVHGLGFSKDGSMIDVISVTTNAATIIQTATNKVLGTVYLGRAPHEGFFTPDGRELWVAVRGENYVSVIDVEKMREVRRIETCDGASKVVFRPDGKVAFVDCTRAAELVVVNVESHDVVKRVYGIADKFTSDLEVSPDGKEVWLPHKMVAKLTIVDAQAFRVLGIISTGPDVNHPNFVSKPDGDFAYLTVGGINKVNVYRRDGGHPQLVTQIPTGAVPHGIWPSPDNTRVYVALQNQDAVQVIDTKTDKVIHTIKIGQDPQALVYVANAVPSGGGDENLGHQNVGFPVIPFTQKLAGGGVATLVIRHLVGVDAVQVEVRDAKPGQEYHIYATKSDGDNDGDGGRLLIGEFRADAQGRGGITPEFAFFEGGYKSAVVAPAE